MNPEEFAQLFALGQSHWWFVGTRDILFSSVRNHHSGGRPILDVGCGSGLMMERLAGIGTVFGIDREEGALRHCRDIGLSRLCRSDAEGLPFKSNTFGFAVASDLLEHCDDDRAVLAELKRVIASGGTLLISVPAYKALWSKHDIVLHHRRRYSKSDLLQVVEETGFVVKRASFFNTFLFVPIALKRLLLDKPGKKQSEETIQYYEGLSFLNQILLAILRMEKWVLNFLNLPFGLSIMVLAAKE